MWEPTSCPGFVERGHAVINVSRDTASPYKQHPAWKAIEQVVVDRKAEEAEGKFGSRIAGLNADIVVDAISVPTRTPVQIAAGPTCARSDERDRIVAIRNREIVLR